MKLDLIGQAYDTFWLLSMSKQIAGWGKDRKRKLQAILPISDLSGLDCLDASCGLGRFSIAMAEMGARSVFAADSSKFALNFVQQKARDLGLCNVFTSFCDFNTASLKPENFDIILCSMALHHYEHPSAVLDKLLGALRSDGTLAMNFHTPSDIPAAVHSARAATAAETDINSEAIKKLVASGINIEDIITPYLWGLNTDLLVDQIKQHSFSIISQRAGHIVCKRQS